MWRGSSSLPSARSPTLLLGAHREAKPLGKEVVDLERHNPGAAQPGEVGAGGKHAALRACVKPC